MSAHASIIDGFTWDAMCGQFLHLCPFNAGLLVDEHDLMIVDCRCYHSRDFLDAQDEQAVKLDLMRGASE